MPDVVEYVAAFDRIEAKYRYEAGLGKRSRREAEQDAEDRNHRDTCDPPCHYTIFEVRTTIEQL